MTRDRSSFNITRIEFPKWFENQIFNKSNFIFDTDPECFDRKYRRFYPHRNRQTPMEYNHRSHNFYCYQNYCRRHVFHRREHRSPFWLDHFCNGRSNRERTGRSVNTESWSSTVKYGGVFDHNSYHLKKISSNVNSLMFIDRIGCWLKLDFVHKRNIFLESILVSCITLNHLNWRTKRNEWRTNEMCRLSINSALYVSGVEFSTNQKSFHNLTA